VAVLGADATKARLAELLGGDTPALLFAACHGVGFPAGSAEQQKLHQGALLCQDWPGPIAWGTKPIEEDFYFAASDVSEGGELRGLMAILVASCAAGTPGPDEGTRQALPGVTPLAPHSFLARLPQRLLARGALAVLGHADSTWGCSFPWSRASLQRDRFSTLIAQLLEGHRVGSAMETLADLYAALSSELSDELQDVQYGKDPDEVELAGLWTVRNDARDLVLLGDPAVRLPGASDGRGR
jgi:hypothetical protein